MYPEPQNNPIGYYGYDASNFDASAYGASGYDANAYNTQQTQQTPMANYSADQNFAAQKPTGFATEPPAVPTGHTQYPNYGNYGTPGVKRRFDDLHESTVTPTSAKRARVDGNGLDDTNSSGYQSGFGSPPSADQTQGSPVNADQYQNQGGTYNANAGADGGFMNAQSHNAGGGNNADYMPPWARYDQSVPSSSTDAANSNGSFNQMNPWAANGDQHALYNNLGANANLPKTDDPKDESDEDKDPNAGAVVPVERPIDPNDAPVYDIMNQLDNETIFAKVPGRLNILSYNKRHPITVAEIRRRISLPEYLNHSVMAAYLRKAKNKEGGQWLTRELQRYQISLQSGRRKQVSNTVFTALCEVEAIMLTRDQHKVVNAYFPINHSIMEIFCNTFSVDEYFVKFHSYFYAMQKAIEFVELMQLDNSPLTSAPLNPPLRCHPETQMKMTKFVNLTHGYGHLAVTNDIEFLIKFISVLLNVFHNPRMYVNTMANEMTIAPVLHAVLTIPPEAYMAKLQQAMAPDYNNPMQQYTGYGMPGMQNGYMNSVATAMQMQQAMFGGYSNPLYMPTTMQMPQDMKAGGGYQTPQTMPTATPMPQGMNGGYPNAQMMQNMNYMNYMQQQSMPQVQQSYF
uniref:TF_AP-2 domain-containing protein n=1 Tax=Panagrellus redivivus TaxID=6233 RepID=A0A7E4ZTJ1_PANRE